MVARASEDWEKRPIAEYYTTESLLGEVEGLITRRQLKSWAEYGLLPAPVRRVPDGATDGVVRAHYPWWTVPVIADLLMEQTSGATIAELQRGADERIACWAVHPLVDPRVALAQVRQAPPTVPRALQRAAWEYAQRYAEAFAVPLARGLTIILHDRDGQQVHVPINALTLLADDQKPED